MPWRTNPVRARQDALNEAMSALNALERVSIIRSIGNIPFAEFHDMLRDAWESSTAFPEAGGEQVCIIEPHSARERPIRVAAVMGLTERVFPRRITEDAFLRDEERVLLRAGPGSTWKSKSFGRMTNGFCFIWQ